MKAHDLNQSSIGIFDSGFGGLTVMKAITNILPHENIIYFGDTAHLPYGNKSAEAIMRYCFENAHFLCGQNIKMLVIACHTASVLALEDLQKKFTLPIIGMIDSGVEKTIQVSKKGSIAILGTRATIESGVYQNQFRCLKPEYDITSIACPLFVPLVEEGYGEHFFTRLVVQEYLRPLKQKQVDTVLLACTHYPLLKKIISEELGPDTLLVDPAITCAEKICDLLVSRHLKNPLEAPPHYQFFVSDDADKFKLLGQSFLNHPIEHVICV